MMQLETVGLPPIPMSLPAPSPTLPSSCSSGSIQSGTLSAVSLAAEQIRERTHTAPGPHLLLFDGVCPMCHGAVRWLLRWDRRGEICFAPLQGPTAKRIAERQGFTIDHSTAIYVRNLCGREEKTHFESSALLRAAGDTGSIWSPLATLARVVPRPLRNVLYRFVARRRFRWFGRYDQCPLPRAEDRARFLP